MKINNFSSSSNLTFAFFFNKSVDLDALNLIASGNVGSLCKCSYESKHITHVFCFDVGGYKRILKENIDKDIVLKYIDALVRLSEFSKRNDMVLENYILQNDCVFIDDKNEIKFVYVPIKRNGSISIAGFFVKAFRYVEYDSKCISDMLAELKAQADDKYTYQIIDKAVKKLASEVENSIDEKNWYSAESETTVLSRSGDAETTVLSRSGDAETTVLSRSGDAETTVLSRSSDAETTVLSRGGDAETTVLSRSGDAETTVLSRSGDAETTVLSDKGWDDAVMEPADKALDDVVRTNGSTDEITAFMYNDSGECETTLLSDGAQSKCESENRFRIIEDIPENTRLILVRTSDGENIHIKNLPFTIGKAGGKADYVSANETVSRLHAVISYGDEGFMIEDMNSTNGTFVEGVKLQPSEKAELDDGYFISLGKETFQIFIERG